MRSMRAALFMAVLHGCVPALEDDCTKGSCSRGVCVAGACVPEVVTTPDVATRPDAARDGEADADADAARPADAVVDNDSMADAGRPQDDVGPPPPDADTPLIDAALPDVLEADVQRLPEVCNGVDDNLDGEIDEAVCSCEALAEPELTPEPAFGPPTMQLDADGRPLVAWLMRTANEGAHPRLVPERPEPLSLASQASTVFGAPVVVRVAARRVVAARRGGEQPRV